MMDEKLIVSLTSWPPRFGNLPIVLDSIYSQTVKPDLVVLNISQGDHIPDFLNDYIQAHGVEVNFVPDTKVYKKLIPTLFRYPNDCVISIDDDWIYPEGMIEDFINIHKRYPNFPISGNSVVYCGIQCHCGCASLTKKSYFGEWLQKIDADVIAHCTSDDIVYSYMTNLAGNPYIRTKDSYFLNMQSYNEVKSYSLTELTKNNDPMRLSYNYLVCRFGQLNNRFVSYYNDPYFGEIISDIDKKNCEYEKWMAIELVKSSWSYRIGNLLLKPFSGIKNFLKSFRNSTNPKG